MISMYVVLAMMTVSVSALPVQDGWDSLIRRRRDSNGCRRPDNVNQLFTSLNANIDTSMYLRPNRDGDTLRPYIERELNVDQAYLSQTYGSRTCPTSVSDNPDDPLWLRSLCPWYYNITDHPGHYPRVIPQAVCKCQNCIDNNLNQCEKVTTHIRVLEETGCQDGFITYRPKTMAVSVGCTCAKRRKTTTTATPSSSAGTGAGADDSSACGPWGCAT